MCNTAAGLDLLPGKLFSYIFCILETWKSIRSFELVITVVHQDSCLIGCVKVHKS